MRDTSSGIGADVLSAYLGSSLRVTDAERIIRVSEAQDLDGGVY